MRSKTHRNKYGAENLLLRNGCSRRHIGEQGRRIEISIGRVGPGGLPHGTAFRNPLFHQFIDRFYLYFIYDGPDIDAFIQGITHDELLHAGFEFGIQGFGNAFLDQ